MVKIQLNRGYYIFKLEDVLKSRKLSINKMLVDTATDFNVAKRLMNGHIARVDLSVLARLCDYLDCDITDIIEYVREDKEHEVSKKC